MHSSSRVRRRVAALLCLSFFCLAGSLHAAEIWIAPTQQADTGGLGVGVGLWPASAAGVTRLAAAVPDDFVTFQSAKIAIIPGAPAGAAVLHVYVCTAQNATSVSANCAGPFDYAFIGVANQLAEVDISTALASRIGGAGAQYFAVVGYTTPTTSTDHIVGMRFGYAAPTVAGPVGPAGPEGPVGPQGPASV